MTSNDGGPRPQIDCGLITCRTSIYEPTRLLPPRPVQRDDPTAFEAVAPASAILADTSDDPIGMVGQRSKALGEAVQKPPTANAGQVQAVKRARGELTEAGNDRPATCRGIASLRL